MIMNRIFILILIYLNIGLFLHAQEIEFSGFGKTGIRIFDRNVLKGYSQEMYYDGKFQIEAEYNKNIEAQLDFRANSIDNSVEIREFSVKFDYADKLNWKVGNIKKPFGYEYSVKRDELISIDRSNAYNRISELGYGGRSVSIMAYYKYSKKREEYPYSYFLSIFKDNSLRSGAVARGIYHSGDYSYGMSYLFQNIGGTNSISAHGIASDFLLKKKAYSTSIEIYFIQDPIEGKIRKAQNKENDTNLNEAVFSAGAKILTSIEYKTDAEVITKIEPFILSSIFLPNTEKSKYHALQALIGANFYFTKKIRMRFNGDLVLTKNDLNDSYVTDESKVILELEVRF